MTSLERFKSRLLSGLKGAVACMALLSSLAAEGGDYDFLREDRNVLVYPEGEEVLEGFFSKLDRLFLTGEGQVRVVHLGDSHIQADHFSGRLRRRLQEFTGGHAGRGWVFPYRAARTNGPGDYSVRYSGRWKRCRNIDEDAVCDLGASGLSITTRSPRSWIRIELGGEQPPEDAFEIVRILHSAGNDSFEAVLEHDGGVRRRVDPRAGETVFELPAARRSFTLRLQRSSPAQDRFTLFGISLETRFPGVVYHSMGVNGAAAEDFLRCVLLEEHIELLRPDLVIVSLGTNDAMGARFDADAFLVNLESLLSRFRSAAPQADLLLTTPGDNYRRIGRRRRVPNRRNLEARKAVLRASRLASAAVWDFFDVMGGMYSIRSWHARGLSSRDRVHLNKRGYELQADLLFEALRKAYFRHIETTRSTR